MAVAGGQYNRRCLKPVPCGAETVNQTEPAVAVAELREQLVELQTQLAFQEDVLQVLDGVVTAQQQQIDQLQRQLDGWRQMVEELQGSMENQRDQAPPPHY